MYIYIRMLTEVNVVPASLLFRENLPGHFKFKEYCPRVFHNLRKRFGVDDLEYMVT